MTTCDASAARLIGVPENFMPGPPGESLWPPTMYWGFMVAVNAVEPTVNGDKAPFVGLSGSVLLPIVSAVAPGARDTGVPDIVIAGLPAASVWLPATYWGTSLAVTA